jgi:cell division protein ZapE
MSEQLLQRYRRLLAQGNIAPDSAQELAVEKLQLLANRLAHYTPPQRTDFFSFFTKRRGEVPRGLYIFGAVGRGKTMLMDLFFQTVPVAKKRRAHFHEFMADVHARLTIARRESKDDPVLFVGNSIASEAQLVCLDELFIVDIADATIVHRLFAALLLQGAVIVVTSNLPPHDLYKNGRNRDLFLPFIDLVEEKMEVLQLEAARDYRLEHLSRGELYFTPVNAAAKAGMDELWQKLTFGEPSVEERLTVLGHEVAVPAASLGSARFGFADLFEKPLGAQDYLALARRYHTIFVDGIPIFSRERRNQAQRFIAFIDTLYDHHTGLVLSAEAEPDALYQAGAEAEMFQRTASRLVEMRSPEYLSKSLAVNGAALRSPERPLMDQTGESAKSHGS